MITEFPIVDSNILSPEGVEERVKNVLCFIVTLTQGGKYRVYSDINGERTPIGKPVATLDEADKLVAELMLMMGLLKKDPEKAIEAMMNSLTKGAPPS